ncbi:hypothetical protein [Pseudogracilibacillus auburnensis]|uniref:hypothetical protein n=1 Tax=Pseudogracilibacillus auburnensis TaxID=1494959 RepID=UPI001A963CFA|nr:hypothetical protein [Pseudogracilibacillus auburnensis]MBO1001999.1 hypothetical protein [Pseudogracilibacillus auburnensis]
MKKVLVATGTSVNKMNSVAETIKKMCADKNVEVDVVAKNIYEVKLDEINPDVIVLLGPNKLETDIPIIDGIAFMTTIGVDQVIDDIINHL